MKSRHLERQDTPMAQAGSTPEWDAYMNWRRTATSVQPWDIWSASAARTRVVLAATTTAAAAMESVLIEDVAYDVPAVVAGEMLRLHLELLAGAQPQADAAEPTQYQRMFEAACVDLGLINEALDLDPDDGGAEPILSAIAELKARVACAQPQADAAEPVGEVHGSSLQGYRVKWLKHPRTLVGTKLYTRAQPAPQALGAAEPELSQAARAVLAERRRQIEAEGWTPEHDDTHGWGQLARAGAAYAAQSLAAEDAELECGPPPWWPWDRSWWKPTSRRRMLEKAGALILAEIERLDRAVVRAAAATTGGQS